MLADGRVKIVFLVGGATVHPVEEQARQIAQWLGDGVVCKLHDGAAAFDDLTDCDLLVVTGLHWTGMDVEWAGGLTYRTPSGRQRKLYEEYVAAARPLLAHHAGIASFDDWPDFGQLLGFTWKWGVTNHSPLGWHKVEILPTGHPLVEGVPDYEIFDELYYEVQLSEGIHPTVHAQATWEHRALPMVMSAEVKREGGTARLVYLANGHDMQAFECESFRQLWVNSVQWLTGRT